MAIKRQLTLNSYDREDTVSTEDLPSYICIWWQIPVREKKQNKQLLFSRTQHANMEFHWMVCLFVFKERLSKFLTAAIFFYLFFFVRIVQSGTKRAELRTHVKTSVVVNERDIQLERYWEKSGEKKKKSAHEKTSGRRCRQQARDWRVSEQRRRKRRAG